MLIPPLQGMDKLHTTRFLPFSDPPMPDNISILGRARLLLGLLLVLVGLPCILLGTQLVLHQSQQDTQDSLDEKASFVIQILENDLKVKQQALQHAATLLEVDGANQITQSQLDTVVHGLNGVIWAGVVSLEGEIILAHKGWLVGADVSKRPWFQEGLKWASVLDRRQALLLAKLLPKREEPYRLIDMSVPIYSSTGNTLGVLAVHIDWDWYEEQFANLIGKDNIHSSYGYAVFGSDNELRLLKSSPDDEAIFHQINFKEGIEQGLASHFFYSRRAGPENGILQGLGWQLYVIENTDVTHKAALSTALFGLVSFLAGLVATALLIYGLLRQVSRKSSEFVDALVSEDAGHLDHLRALIPLEMLPLSSKAEKLIAELRSKRAVLESALTETKNSYLEINRLVAQAPVAMAMFDNKMTYLARSDLWISTYIQADMEVIGKCHYEMNYTVPEKWKAVHQAALGGHTLREHGDAWLDSTGRKRWLNWTVQPWRTHSGAVGGIIIMIEDVTAEHESKVALSKSEERFQLAMQGSHDGLWDWNLKTNEIYFSPSWKTMLGYEVDELQSSFETWANLMHPEDVVGAKKVLNAALNDPQKTHFTNIFRLAHKQGRWVKILARGFIQRNAEGKARRVVGTHLDRTEVEELQSELQEAWIAAQAEARSNETKSRFLALVSHEIRNPLNSVCGFARLIEEEVQEPEVKRHAQLLLQTTGSLTMVLNDLLDVAKIESGQLEIHPVASDLAVLMDSLAESGQVLCREKKLQFEYSTRWAGNTHFVADAGRIRQIVQNLLSNAVKFTHQGEVVLRVYTQAQVADIEELVIELHDTGIGMNPAKRDKLFKPFHQLHEDGANQYGGTGLGLSIVKSLTDLMKGTIHVESVEGQGTRFRVAFKLQACAPVRTDSPGTVVQVTPRRILIADDSPTNLKILSKFLGKRGHLVTTANNGAEAIKQLDHAHFEYVILDMNMPEYDGCQVVAHAKVPNALNSQAVFACLTGDTEQFVREKALADGFERIFLKPANLDELLEFVQ